MRGKEELFLGCLHATYCHTAESGEYAIEVTPNVIYLYFQWSNGWQDWKNNLDFPARPYGDMKPCWFAHRGFARVWRAMRSEIRAYVKGHLALSPNLQEIICVGYSHGGALALLATEDMTYQFGKQCRVSGYGFGAPRVLWGPIPREVKKRLSTFTVVRNVPDIVTHVPPALWGYRHVGRMETIGQKGKYSLVDAHRPEAYLAELHMKKRHKK